MAQRGLSKNGPGVSALEGFRLDRLEVKVIDLEDGVRDGFARLDDRLKTVEAKIQ
jgi:hypothetical protein